MRAATLFVALLLAGCAVTPPSDPSASVPAASDRFASAAPASSPAPPLASSSPVPSPHRSPAMLSAGQLRDAVSGARVMQHLAELSALTEASGGHRAAGSPGFAAAVDFVAARLASAGYEVRRQPVDTPAGTTWNVIATRGGTVRDAGMVVVGAHLDSVAAGPGSNDNGSGAMALLALAEATAALPAPRRTLVFAFWGAEEVGHLGSQAFVADLGEAERASVTAYLNLDIIGSPNFIRFVYAEPAAAAGSRRITRLFAEHFEAEGLAWEPIDLTGKSDHESFTAGGIPTGGVFSGGTEPKTDAQAASFGGTAGEPADPCIHATCDRLASVNDRILMEMLAAVAHVTALLATDQ